MWDRNIKYKLLSSFWVTVLNYWLVFNLQCVAANVHGKQNEAWIPSPLHMGMASMMTTYSWQEKWKNCVQNKRWYRIIELIRLAVGVKPPHYRYHHHSLTTNPYSQQATGTTTIVIYSFIHCLVYWPSHMPAIMVNPDLSCIVWWWLMMIAKVQEVVRTSGQSHILCNNWLQKW